MHNHSITPVLQPSSVCATGNVVQTLVMSSIDTTAEPVNERSLNTASTSTWNCVCYGQCGSDPGDVQHCPSDHLCLHPEPALPTGSTPLGPNFWAGAAVLVAGLFTFNSPQRRPILKQDSLRKCCVNNANKKQHEHSNAVGWGVQFSVCMSPHSILISGAATEQEGP